AREIPDGGLRTASPAMTYLYEHGLSDVATGDRLAAECKQEAQRCTADSECCSSHCSNSPEGPAGAPKLWIAPRRRRFGADHRLRCVDDARPGMYAQVSLEMNRHPTAISDQADAQILQIVGRQARHQVSADPVFTKCRLVLFKP